MIEVKGTRSEAAGQAQTEVYAPEPEKKPKGAMAIGLLMLSLVLYFRTFFGRRAEAQTDPTESVEDVGTPSPVPQEIVVAGEKPAAETAEEAAESTGSPPLVAVDFAARPDTIELFSNARAPSFAVVRPAGLVHGQANDNAAPARHRGPTSPEGPGMPPLPFPGTFQPPEAAESPEVEEPVVEDGEAPEDREEPAPPRSAPNRAPTVARPVMLGDLQVSALMAIGLGDLLRHATDPDGDLLGVRNLQASSGRLAESGEGWEFGADCEVGLVTLTYEVTDGEAAVTQIAQFNVVPNAIGGTEGDDLLVGTRCSDTISAFGGDDNIDGRGGDDMLIGGAGDDHLLGGAGDDTLRGGAGDDILIGGKGNDLLAGGSGNDRLFGGAGADTLFGDEGDDLLEGGAGHDLLFGGDGGDTLDGGAGEDRVSGDGGDDHVIGNTDGAADSYVGGAGEDRLDYSTVTGGMTIDLARGTASGAGVGDDSFREFEEISAGTGDDHLLIGGKGARISGGEGEDIFEVRSTSPEAEGDEPSREVFELLDFEVGDRLRMGAREFFEEAWDQAEDMFERIYGAEAEDGHGPLRYRNDWAEDEDERRTVIEADFDGNGTFEIAVWLAGEHRLLTHELA